VVVSTDRVQPQGLFNSLVLAKKSVKAIFCAFCFLGAVISTQFKYSGGMIGGLSEDQSHELGGCEMLRLNVRMMGLFVVVVVVGSACWMYKS
jgi:hypothetical protein